MNKKHFQPPYYAVIFINQLSEDIAGYHQMAQEMVDLAQTMPGFLGYQSAREQTGITVSFWQDEASIQHWKNHSRHLVAQKSGKQQWYSSYQIHVARVERFNQYKKGQ